MIILNVKLKTEKYKNQSLTNLLSHENFFLFTCIINDHYDGISDVLF